MVNGKHMWRDDEPVFAPLAPLLAMRRLAAHDDPISGKLQCSGAAPLDTERLEQRDR